MLEANVFDISDTTEELMLEAKVFDIPATTANLMLEPKVANLMPEPQDFQVPWFIPAFVGEARFQFKFAEQCCTDEEKLYQSYGISPELLALAAEYDISLTDLTAFDERTATAGAYSAASFNDLYDSDDNYHAQPIS